MSKSKKGQLSRYRLISLLEIIHRSIDVSVNQDLSALLVDVAQFLPISCIAAIGGRIESNGIAGNFQNFVQHGPADWMRDYCATPDSTGVTNSLSDFLNSPSVLASLQHKSSSISRVGRFRGILIARETERLSFRSALVFLSVQNIDLNSLLPIINYLAPHLHAALIRATFSCVAKEYLSKREREVLRWVGLGKTSSEIAKILQITERTVVFHIQNAMKKLGVSKRSHAVAHALASGLVHPGFTTARN